MRAVLTLPRVINPTRTEFERACPFCRKTVYYKTAEGLARAIKRGTRCLSCSRHKDYDILDRIRDAHAYGLSNRQIAKVVGRKHLSVALALKSMGLESNVIRPGSLRVVDGTHGECWLCGKTRLLDEFPRQGPNGKRSGYCGPCKALKHRENVHASPEAYFAFRQRSLASSMSSKRRRRGLDVDLPTGYLAAIWHWQGGLCFYTDEPMTLEIGKGRHPTSASVDRVDSARGYVAGNLVLCRNRVNSIKTDMTLDEMSRWTPGWYDRIVNRLPRLNDELVIRKDERPRKTDGTLVPQTHAVSRARYLQYLSDRNIEEPE